jgi:anti-anti-sigma regulatory factor
LGKWKSLTALQNCKLFDIMDLRQWQPHCPSFPAAMLRITVDNAGEDLRLTLEGKLAGSWVREFRECWQKAAPGGERRIVVDLREVDFVDSDGQIALADLRRAGARFVVSTPVMQAVVRAVCHAVRCGTVEREGRPSPECRNPPR